ncbi:hypothetical protein DSLPV1_146 [Dishui lake phycodnavirus 1]|uniref:hypothetical protein n=1 Tax=Dishui lake phycodnavirus 1 TaxID=2079134 RepID=UPI000CD68AA3|nr:hypothetical protein C5Y57_gp146 [Dishui lake phycodnavirus 1]AUT19117.1 hypothetical protein DSLPV1_146 [Dishui lake phycodnavirus 1]
MGVQTRSRAKVENDQPIQRVEKELSELDVLRLEYQALREQNEWLFARLEKLEVENEELLGRRRPMLTQDPRARSTLP